LRHPLLVFLLHLKPSLLDGLPLCNILGVFGGSRPFSLTLALSLLTLQLLLTSRLFLLSSPLTFDLTLLFQLTLSFLLILETN